MRAFSSGTLIRNGAMLEIGDALLRDFDQLMARHSES